MLSPADRSIVERDAALPGLGVLLDPSAVRDLLREEGVGGGALTSVTPRYLRYKPGTNALVAYDVVVGGRRESLYAKAYAASDGAHVDAKLRKPDRRAVMSPSLGVARVLVPDLGIVASAFPNDHKVRNLGAVCTAATREAWLRRALPGRPDLWQADLASLSYKPERRFVGALRVGGEPRAVLRMHASGARATTSPPFVPPGLRVPCVLGGRGSRGVSITSWLDGTPLDRGLATARTERIGLAVGRATAMLHASRAGTLPVRRAVDEREAVEAAVSLIGVIAPDLGPSAADLALRLAVMVRSTSAAVPIHGDLHVGQVLLGAGGIGLVDFDEVCLGDAASDLGSLLASVLASAAVGHVTADAARALCDDIVDGYAQEAGRVPTGVDAWVGTHLLRRVPQAFRERHATWMAVATRLVDLAREAMDAPRWREVATRSRQSVADDAMPAMAMATVPRTVEAMLATRLGPRSAHVRVCDIRIVRHKAGRRCLIEYDLCGLPPRPDQVVTVIGKVRARGADTQTAALMAALWAGDLAPDSPHGVSVPQPLGVVPSLSMWLQARVSGAPATEWVFGPDAMTLLPRAAAALRRLHTSGVPVARVHRVADEIAILQSRMDVLRRARPDLSRRLDAVVRGVAGSLEALPAANEALLHRDMHPDHLIWNGERLYLIDFDLAARGDAGVDVGNLAAHLLELGLRRDGSLGRLQGEADAFVNAYVSEAADVESSTIDCWTTASLARLTCLSVELPGRQHTTDALLAACERRLAAASGRHVPIVTTETWP